MDKLYFLLGLVVVPLNYKTKQYSPLNNNKYVVCYRTYATVRISIEFNKKSKLFYTFCLIFSFVKF